MGELADSVKAITVQVTSPDNNLRAVLRNDGDITVDFRPKSYPQYTERDLAHQITRVATLLYTGYYRAYGKVVEKFNMDIKRGPEDARSPAEHGYFSDRATLQVVGAGDRKLVRLKATGLLNWECRIAQGTIEQLSEDEFKSELHSAIRNFLSRYRAKITSLRGEHFDDGVQEQMVAYLKQQRTARGTRAPG